MVCRRSARTPTQLFRHTAPAAQNETPPAPCNAIRAPPVSFSPCMRRHAPQQMPRSDCTFWLAPQGWPAAIMLQFWQHPHSEQFWPLASDPHCLAAPSAAAWHTALPPAPPVSPNAAAESLFSCTMQQPCAKPALLPFLIFPRARTPRLFPPVAFHHHNMRAVSPAPTVT